MVFRAVIRFRIESIGEAGVALLHAVGKRSKWTGVEL
jgi:hypothetical protein